MKVTYLLLAASCLGCGKERRDQYGSTWNRTLVHPAGDIAGKEARALGYTNIYTPILDVARDPHRSLLN